MDQISDWVFPTTLVGDAMKFRPLILDSLYRREINPWCQTESTLAKICMQNGIDESAFLREIASLPVPGADSDWENLPCFHLIDFLTFQHREFLQVDLPAIHYRMRIAGEVGLSFQMGQSLFEFGRRLQSHITAEEDEIFPRILRNEYAVRHPDWNEGIDVDRRKVGVAARLLGNEEEFAFTLDWWIRQVSDVVDDAANPHSVSAVAILLKELEANIRTHARLEVEQLYPMASQLEESLLRATSAK